jgi:zinc finger protein
LDREARRRWDEFFNGLLEAKSGKRKFTCILDDPLAASYVQNLYAPDPDPQLTIVDVERTKEQEDDLGISDMVTEGYEQNES